jgi:hypothetical protein
MPFQLYEWYTFMLIIGEIYKKLIDFADYCRKMIIFALK